MDSDEAEQVGKFRAYLAGASVEDLAYVAACTLDACIDVIRSLGRSNAGTEMAAALAAEVHKRMPAGSPAPPFPQRSPMLGHA